MTSLQVECLELLTAIINKYANGAYFLENDLVIKQAKETLITYINNINIADIAELYNKLDDFEQLYDTRVFRPELWKRPVVHAANELVRENGIFTKQTISLITNTLLGKSNTNDLVSSTNKKIIVTPTFANELSQCSFKKLAINKLIDFIDKFTQPNAWVTWFEGNIGKNNNAAIQEYHPMNKYNKKHGTKIIAMHLGSDTHKCVVATVDSIDEAAKGEPNTITLEEIGAHTLIDRYDESYNIKTADVSDLAEIFNLKETK